MSLLIVIPVVNAVAVFLLVRSRSGQFSAMPRGNAEPNPSIHFSAHR
jgi:hypothetical protein